MSTHIFDPTSSEGKSRIDVGPERSHIVRRAGILAGKVAIAVTTGLFLVSFGGQVVAAPVLVPLNILCIRTATRPGAIAWAVAGGLLTLEAAGLYVAVFHAWWGIPIGITALLLGVGGITQAVLLRFKTV